VDLLLRAEDGSEFPLSTSSQGAQLSQLTVNKQIFGGFKKNDGKVIQLDEEKNSNKLVQLAPRILEQVHWICQDFWDEILWTYFKSVVEDQRSLLKMAQHFPKKKQTPGR